MNTAVFSFIRPSKTSVIASVRIARFIARTLHVPLLYDEQIKRTRWDLLILVNGAFSFCSHRDDVAVAVRRAKRIIWVQNDYAIYAPISDGQAESTFRKAFRLRRDRGFPDMDHWTTIKPKARMTRSSRYINWNMLTALPVPLDCARRSEDDLFYYGAFRSDRRHAFDRYLKPTKVSLAISSSSKKFAERYPHAKIISAIPRQSFYEELNGHGLGLYIEDPRSHKEFHSPANRFYEMLSAGLPMVFEPDAATMLRSAGYRIDDYVVETQRDARTQLKHRRAIQAAQRRDWWEDYSYSLTRKLRNAFVHYMARHFS